MGLEITGNNITPTGASTVIDIENIVMTGSSNPVILNLSADQTQTNFPTFTTSGALIYNTNRTQGSQGSQGGTGATGFVGNGGAGGPQGPQAARGSQGNQGNTGFGGFTTKPSNFSG